MALAAVLFGVPRLINYEPRVTITVTARPRTITVPDSEG